VEGVQVDDYINFSSIGLLEALERFDPSYGVSFKTYARSRIRGEVLNNITKFSEKAHSLTARRKLLKQRLGLVQDKQDLNKPLESIVDTILDLALGFLIEDKSSTEQDLRLGGADYDSLEVKAIQANVFILMGQLPPDQKSIMELHYKEHVGFSEIAERLNISKGRVSQLHSQSLESLRRKLKW
jgi:RNA polymerase sigma factor for flagellar operon FliA